MLLNHLPLCYLSTLSLNALSLSPLSLCALSLYALYLDYASTLGYVHIFHNDVISLRSLSMISLLYTIAVPSPHRYTTLCNHFIAVLSLYHRCNITSYYHRSVRVLLLLHAKVICLLFYLNFHLKFSILLYYVCIQL